MTPILSMFFPTNLPLLFVSPHATLEALDIDHVFFPSRVPVFFVCHMSCENHVDHPETHGELERCRRPTWPGWIAPDWAFQRTRFIPG